MVDSGGSNMSNSAYNATAGGEASSFHSRPNEWPVPNLFFFSHSEGHCGRRTRYFCPGVIFHRAHHALHFILSFIAIWKMFCVSLTFLRAGKVKEEEAREARSRLMFCAVIVALQYWQMDGVCGKWIIANELTISWL